MRVVECMLMTGHGTHTWDTTHNMCRGPWKMHWRMYEILAWDAGECMGECMRYWHGTRPQTNARAWTMANARARTLVLAWVAGKYTGRGQIHGTRANAWARDAGKCTGSDTRECTGSDRTLTWERSSRMGSRRHHKGG